VMHPESSPHLLLKIGYVFLIMVCDGLILFLFSLEIGKLDKLTIFKVSCHKSHILQVSLGCRAEQLHIVSISRS